MAKVYEEITAKVRDFLLAQKVFFVATAPSDLDGHINLSPKGLNGTLAVLDPHRVAYLETNGSGVETIAHLRDTRGRASGASSVGRIVLMACAFEGPPNIVRLHGRGSIVLDTAPLMHHFPDAPHGNVRSIVVIDVDRVSDSCGYGVPFMDYVGDRDLLPQWWERKDAEQRAEYHAVRNATSIDGIPVGRDGLEFVP